MCSTLQGGPRLQVTCLVPSLSLGRGVATTKYFGIFNVQFGPLPVYPISSCRARVDSSLDVAVLRRPVLELENWAEIKEEMMVSNVIQRDNVILARKLHPDLEPAAKINDKNVRMRIYRLIDIYIG